MSNRLTTNPITFLKSVYKDTSKYEGNVHNIKKFRKSWSISFLHNGIYYKDSVKIGTKGYCKSLEEAILLRDKMFKEIGKTIR